MTKSDTKTSPWLYAAVAPVVAIIIAAIHWSFSHPYGTSWDEALYLNEVLIDAQRLVHGMLPRLAGRILIRSYGRPPAYQILDLPFLMIFGINTTSARLLSLTCFALSAWYVYRATRRFTGQAAGAFAALVFALSPLVVSASIWISTEGPLYLATSAFLYYVFVSCTDDSDRASTWIGLGLSFGLGFLAKASFAAIAFPVLCFWFLAARWGKLRTPALSSQIKAGTLAFLVAGPWWILNLRTALTNTESARAFAANSLGPPSIATWIMWLNTVIQSLLGIELSILIGLVVIVAAVKYLLRKQIILNSLDRMTLGVCACAGLPIVIAQLSGTNHLLRHISPAVIPLAVVLGVLAERTEWIRYRPAILISGVLFCAQLLTIIVPSFLPNKRAGGGGFANAQLPWMVMLHRDQWDWTPLRNIADSLGCQSPTISFMGDGPGFSPPQMEYPWVVRAVATSNATLALADVKWLWQPSDGPIDWQKVMKSAEQSDIAITAPKYSGEWGGTQNPGDQNNAEFADRLSQNPHFRAPIRFEVGRFESIEISVFVNNSIACHSDQPPPTTR